MTMRRRESVFLSAGVILSLLVWAGCGDYEMAPPKGRSAAPEAVGVAVDPDALAAPVKRSAPQTPPAQTPSPGTQTPAAALAPVSPAAPAGQPPAGQAASTPPGYQPPMSYQAPASQGNLIREKAEVGMGRKGHYGQGFIMTPLSTFWRTKEMVAYRVQVPEALKLYKATNGYYPKTQEEFVREILTPNGIKLPELPQGHFYVYDPEKGELQVARPQ
jgi:hypothetical protein